MLLFAFVYLYISENGKKTKAKMINLLKHGWLMGFLFYLALILSSTVFARSVETPYRNIFGSFGFRNDLEWDFHICMNILMFIPYTFLYIKAFKPGNVWKSSLLLSGATTLFIEFSQLLFWLGEFQISDIVHNILGGLIGCTLCFILDKKILTRFLKWAGRIGRQWRNRPQSNNPK